jgi:hypothetical protein
MGSRKRRGKKEKWPAIIFLPSSDQLVRARKQKKRNGKTKSPFGGR